MGIDIINSVIECAGRIRCVKAEDIKKHEADVVELQKQAGQGNSMPLYIGAAESVLSATATAVLLSNPVGWVGLAALAVAVAAGAGVGTDAFERVTNRRRANKQRALTEWEENYFQPWLGAVVKLGDSLLTPEAVALIDSIAVGSSVDPKMGGKALGDWCVSVAEDPKAFTIDDFALMLTIRHITDGLDKQPEVVESLFEALGEADVVFANADLSGARNSFQYFPVWLGPKIGASGSPYLTPVSKSLGRIVSDYYVQSASEGKLLDQVRVLLAAYYVKLHMKFAE